MALSLLGDYKDLESLIVTHNGGKAKSNSGSAVAATKISYETSSSNNNVTNKVSMSLRYPYPGLGRLTGGQDSPGYDTPLVPEVFVEIVIS